jgi:hypothetical protein
MKPVPHLQRRQSHRQRLALGRALHQVRFRRGPCRRNYHRRRFNKTQRLLIPRLLRRHAVKIGRVWFGYDV